MSIKEPARSDLKWILESNPTLQQILQNISQVVWIVDLSTAQIVYVCPAFETVWGQPCQALYADPQALIKSVHPEDRVKVMSLSPQDARQPLSLAFRILRPDGASRWISTQTFFLYDDARDPAFQIFIAEDISPQKEIDQTLQKALDRSHEQFTFSRRMSLARKPEAVLKTLVSASEFHHARRAFLLFFESPLIDAPHEIEVLASWSSLPSAVSDPSGPAHEVELVEAIAAADLFHPSKPVIISNVPKDPRLDPAIQAMLLKEQIQTIAMFPMVALGKWLGCFLVYFPQVIIFEPVEIRHIKVLVDQASITLNNLKLLETEAESRREAERANEIKTELLATISHELRTPLTSILGFTNTLLAEDVSWQPEEQRDFIQTIQRESNRLQELIDQLLVFSRLESGMLPISREPIFVREVIRDALPQLQVLTTGHTLAFRLPAALPLIDVDAKRIVQVLVNLVRNAAAYSPRGTEITISAHVRGQFLQMNVIDQGPGISANEHSQVFKAFRRGSSAENGPSQGAGLGLAICKGLIEAHHGQIWIKKKAPPGTIISFTVPLAARQPLQNATIEEP